mmetsp:Transcript_857/g.3137  ORF Transcript_857/g.3137 Transcript_857/m.3137 type:complete len:439 (+) Transcript_857:137-1453(+)
MPLWNKEPEHLVKLVLVGDAGVGKTSLLLRFTENRFDSKPSTVAVDFKLTTFKVNGKYIKLQIWDTAGQERFKTISSAYYRGAHGVLLMYDMTRAQSFANLTDWVREMDHHCTAAVNVVLVANKCDLSDSRAVASERMEELAESRGWKYLEASGKTGTNVQQAIRSLVNQILKNRAFATQFASLHAPGGLSKIASVSSPSLSSALRSVSGRSVSSFSEDESDGDDSNAGGSNPSARVVVGSPEVRGRRPSAERPPVEGTIRLGEPTPPPAGNGGPACCSGGAVAFEEPSPSRSRSAQSLGLGQGIEVEWEPDSASSACRKCDGPFTAVRRRHHCRWCGKLFCKSCCSNKLARDRLPVALIPNSVDVKRGLKSKVRLCSTCHKWVTSVAEKEAAAATAAENGAQEWVPTFSRTVSADVAIEEKLQVRSRLKSEVAQSFR